MRMRSPVASRPAWSDSDEGFNLLLDLFDSIITYRARFQGRREMLPLLDLLVFDTDSTRCACFGGAHAARSVAQARVRHDGAWACEVTDPLPTPEHLVDRADGRARCERAACIELIAALHRMVACAVRELSDAIGNHLFAHVVGADRSVWQ